MRRTVLVVMTVLGLSTLAVAVYAAGPGHGMMGGPILGGQLFRMMRMADELELSKEQRTEIDRIIDAARPSAREYVYTLGDGREALRALSEETEFDEKRVRALAEEHARSLAELMVIGLRLSAEVNAVLSPEQRVRLAEMKAAHRKHRKHDE